MTRRSAATLLIGLVMMAGPVRGQEPYQVEIPDLRPKPYSIGGYLETRPFTFWLDHEAALYRLRYVDQTRPDRSWQVSSQVLLDAGYHRGMLSFSSRSVVDATRSETAWSTRATSYEASLSLKPSPSFAVDLGKRTLRWGKGYAWNPVAFLDRPKNPDDPAQALEGYVVASADFIRSFDGPLQTLSLTPVLVPVYDGVNESLGRTGHLDAAAKAYVLLYDTDIDVMFLSGGSRTRRWGFDFSRNLRSDIELHGEFGFIDDARTTVVTEDGQLAEQPRSGTNWVIGTRYLTPFNTTVIVEYYRNGSGYTEAEMDHYFALVNQAVDGLEATGDRDLLSRALSAQRHGYGERQPMRNYLFLRASQPDLLNVLYLNAAAIGIYNVDDHSFSVTQEMQYRALNNLELRSQVGVIGGGRGTDFGEKPADLRLEVRVRYYF